MEYFKDGKGNYSKLKQRNVDTGLGLERMTMLLQGKKTPYEIEIFAPVMKKLEELQKVDNVESRRIVTEHLRSSMMIINDGGKPSNVDRGYILRRLLRRMTRHLNKLGIDLELLPEIIDVSIDSLKELYPELAQNRDKIVSVIVEEKNKFMKTLQNGEREFSKAVKRAESQGKDMLDAQVVFNFWVYRFFLSWQYSKKQ